MNSDGKPRLPWWQLLPVVLPLLLLFGGGLTWTLAESLSPGTDPYGTELQGFQSYPAALSTPDFASALGFSVKVGLLSALFSTLCALGLAVLVHSLPNSLSSLAQGFYLPLILPPVSAAYLTVFWFSQSGMVSSVFENLGLQYGSPLFAGDGLGIVLAYVYKETPFGLLMLLPVLRGISPRLVETARLLGAGSLQIFRTLVLPRLAPALASVFLILAVYSFGAYDIPAIVGESRPSMVSILVHRSFFLRPLSERPLAAAFLVLIFLFSLCAVAIYSRLVRRLDDKERTI